MEGMMNRNTVPGLPPHPFMRSLCDKGKAIAIETDQPTINPNKDNKQKRWIKVMASRQYSRNYRLKQEQYIQHLENKVKVLEVEISILSTRLKYMTRKNSLERLENVLLKQKLSALTGEYNFKQAQQVELNKENDGLKQLYGQQQQHRYMNYPYWSA
ncbi:hypothetical protein ACOSQ3_004037 [Xanthoceras sorbifolium]